MPGHPQADTPPSGTGDDKQVPFADHDAVRDIGARLRLERTRARLGLRELARRLGVSPSFLSQLETGKTRASVATLYGICSELGLSIDELFAVTRPSVPAVADPAPEPAPARGAAKRKRPPAAREAAGPVGTGSVVTPAQRRVLVLDSGVRWEQLTNLRSAPVDFMHVTYEVGGSSTTDGQLTRHASIEYGYVMTGTLEVSLAFDSYVLHPGDAISFDSSTPHRMTNVGDVPVHTIWFVLDRA
jgi:transcriptional regulator with XRE-family HTH domain